jgi:glycyl-tRNA synthetase beta chain
LQKALDEAIAKLPIPKVMSYQLETDCAADCPAGAASTLCARPMRWWRCTAATVVPVKALGLHCRAAAHKATALKRLCPRWCLKTADSYAATLAKDGAVIASFAERRADIARQLAAAAQQVGGGCKPIDDEALLDEVTGLVERPQCAGMPNLKRSSWMCRRSA